MNAPRTIIASNNLFLFHNKIFLITYLHSVSSELKLISFIKTHKIKNTKIKLIKNLKLLII